MPLKGPRASELLLALELDGLSFFLIVFTKTTVQQFLHFHYLLIRKYKFTEKVISWELRFNLKFHSLWPRIYTPCAWVQRPHGSWKAVRRKCSKLNFKRNVPVIPWRWNSMIEQNGPVVNRKDRRRGELEADLGTSHWAPSWANMESKMRVGNEISLGWLRLRQRV